MGTLGIAIVKVLCAFAGCPWRDVQKEVIREVGSRTHPFQLEQESVVV
jgi:hypothetical protein